jgi:adenosine deaminase
VAYIELRTTPRATPHMSRRVYLETVLDEIEARAPDTSALIVSLDRRMTLDVAREVLELVVQLRREGRRVVGVDLCGDPRVRSMFFVAFAVDVVGLSGLIMRPFSLSFPLHRHPPLFFLFKKNFS